MAAAPPPTDAPAALAGDGRASRASLRLLGMTRFLIVIGVVSLLVAATVLLAYGAKAAYELILQVAAPEGGKVDKDQLILASIKLVDLILLATVLYITAIGLYELFIDSRLPLPAWLRVAGIDDLKQKLTSVVITVLGVVFLGQVVSWRGGDDILPLGGAVAAVVAALSYFLSVQSGKAKAPKGERDMPP